MSAEVLKEFLVSIGWKSDEEGARKIGEQIRTMTLGAVALGASLESLAVTAFAVTARISKSYSDIYYQSKKVGDSAGNIKAFGYAVEQLGGSAEEAGATLESFYRKIGAGGPGQEKWLEQFIGQTRDAKGALRETSEMVDSFLHSKKFMNSPEYLQRRYIEMAGISENVWRASKDPNKYLDEHGEDIRNNLTSFVNAVTPFVVAFTNAALKVGEFASAIAKYLGPDTTAWLIIVGLGLKFTGLATIITGAAIPAVVALAKALAGLTAGAAGVGLRALAALVGGPLAVALGIGATLYPTPAGEGENEQQRQENVKRDPDYYKPGHPGGVDNPPKAQDPGKVPKTGAWERTKGAWESTKQWFNDKIGIAPAEARETVEGQPGGETPPAAKGHAGRGRNNLTSEQRIEMAGAIRKVAKDRGIDPNDLAGIMSFETGGTMDPHKWGGDSGKYRGLIQWSPSNRKEYFAKYGGFERATITQQVEEAGRYLADRGVKPGDGLTSIYSAVLAGNADKKYWDRRDSNRTSPRSGAASIRRSAHADALANLERKKVADKRAAQTTPNVAPEVAPQRPVHVPPVNVPQPTSPRAASPTTPQAPPHATSPRPLGHTTSNSVRHGDISLNQKTSINVQTPGDAGAAARAIAGMQNTVNADAIRNMQGAAH